MDKVLTLCKSPQILKFRFCTSYGLDDPKDGSSWNCEWISEAIRRRVYELDVKFRYMELPVCFFYLQDG